MFDLANIRGIYTPQELNGILAGIVMPATEKIKLHRKMANLARKSIRTNLSKQVDIDGKAFVSRKKQAYTVTKLGKLKVKHKMLTGFSRHLISIGNADGLAVGFTSAFAGIADVHNQGKRIDWQNKKTKTSGSYTMPKRQFLGWSKQLSKQLVDEISKSIGAK